MSSYGEGELWHWGSASEQIRVQAGRIAELEQDNAALASEAQQLKRQLSDRDAEAKQFKAEIGRLHDELADAKRKVELQRKACQLLMNGNLGELATEAALKAVRGEE